MRHLALLLLALAAMAGCASPAQTPAGQSPSPTSAPAGGVPPSKPGEPPAASAGPSLLFQRWIAPVGVTLMRPVAVAVTQTGQVLVADAGLFRVMQFSDQGAEMGSLGGAAAGSRFEEPMDIAIGPSLSVFVLVGDAVERRVDQYDLAGNLVGTFVQLSSPQRPAALSDPRAIAVDANGTMYVSDIERDEVLVFGPDGQPRYTFGNYGTAEGSFIDPRGMAIDQFRDRLYIADSGNQRIQVFDLLGGLRGSFALEDGSRPAGLDVDSRGRVWVADPGKNRIVVFDPMGNELLSSDGAHSGSRGFRGVQDVAVSRDGIVFVADTANARVGAFTVLSPKGGP